jgi:hypothetical protein
MGSGLALDWVAGHGSEALWLAGPARRRSDCLEQLRSLYDFAAVPERRIVT